jgi:dihydromonapterin reductase/dihydrofolate reductase
VKTGYTLITGIGRRAGFHLARSFLERGRPVIGTFRTDYARLHKLESLGAELHRCDFNDRDDVERLIAAVKSGHRDLRGIIHNASQWLAEGGDTPDSIVIDTMMRVHAGIPYELNQALSPLLQAHEGPHTDIIHIGDYVSSRGSKKHIAYAASKAAQDNLTLSFAQKLAPKVKVNSVAPALLAFNDDDDEAYKKKALSKSLMRREGGLEELRLAVDYLFDSRYVTGRILPLDGGRHLR